jgi:formylglycine-generating enzyme required for sulfatase activity
VILTVCLSISLATAQNKVVVVPLGGKKCTSPMENSFTNSIGMTFNLIPAGTFTMGSPDGSGDEPAEPGRFSNETQHQVTLTKPFYMQVTEVTQQQWQEVIVKMPATSNIGDEYPIETVNWFEAAWFANALSQREGRSQCYILTSCSRDPGDDMECTGVGFYPTCTGYRLPTEAQWEYAARAGTTTAYANPYSFDATNTVTDGGFNSNLAAMGWYVWNNTISGYTGGTKPVAQKQANRWGLYDMHGNVYEWCQDGYADYPAGSVTDPQGLNYHFIDVVRGGSWSSEARYERSAYRYGAFKGYRFYDLGFRLTLPPGQ